MCLTFMMMMMMMMMVMMYTAISKKVVGKSARDNPKRYCGWLSSLFFTEIWKNGTWGHGHTFASAKGKHWQINSTATIVTNSVLIISHVTFRDCRVHIFPTTFLEIALYSQCSTGNQFPVQVTSCKLSSREPVGGFVSHIKIHPYAFKMAN